MPEVPRCRRRLQGDRRTGPRAASEPPAGGRRVRDVPSVRRSQAHLNLPGAFPASVEQAISRASWRVVAGPASVRRHFYLTMARALGTDRGGSPARATRKSDASIAAVSRNRLTSGPSLSSDRDALGMTRSGQDSNTRATSSLVAPCTPTPGARNKPFAARRSSAGSMWRTDDRPDRSDPSGSETGVQFSDTAQQRLFDTSTGPVERRLNVPALGI